MEETKKCIGKQNNIVITGMEEPNDNETKSKENIDRRNVKENLKAVNMPRTDKIKKNIKKFKKV